MNYFVSESVPRVVLVVFERDDLLLEGLVDVARKENIDTATITGGIGSLQRLNVHTFARFGFPPEEKPLTFGGAIEIGGIQGSVVGGEVHAHITFFHWDSMATWIGHLEEGSRVAYLAEVTLLALEGVQTERFRTPAGEYGVRVRGVSA
jgi:predicted DNA-binding protein with PD1-like motif